MEWSEWFKLAEAQRPGGRPDYPAVVEEACFTDVRATARDTFDPDDPEENLFKVWGTRAG